MKPEVENYFGTFCMLITRELLLSCIPLRSQELIWFLPLPFFPLLKNFLCRRKGIMKEWNLPVCHSCINLCIYEMIIKFNGSGIFFGVRINDSFRPGSINSAKAHGARFATGIDFTSCQLMGTKLVACITNGYYFGVCSWIIGRCYFVPAFANDFISPYNNASKRSTGSVLHSPAG